MRASGWILLFLIAPALSAQDKPGPEHQRLAPLVGDFSLTQKEFGEDGKLVAELTGTLKRSLLLGGLFLQEESELKGKNFASRVQVWLGYDIRKKKYLSVSINDQSTYAHTAAGTFDPALKAIVFLHESTDPDTKKVTRSREVYEIRSDDEQTFTEYVTLPDQPEMRTLEIRYLRKKL